MQQHDVAGTGAEPTPPKVAPESVALRAAPQPVTRLNRRTLALLVGSGAAVVLGATIWSLQPRERRVADSAELYNVDRISRAEGLASLPRDYSQMPAPKPVEPAPVLGDPLPGDLGRPVLRAEREACLHAPGGPASPDAEPLARVQEAEEPPAAPDF